MAEQKAFRVFVRLRPAQHTGGQQQQHNNGQQHASEEETGATPPTSARGAGENGVCNVEHRIITLHDPTKGHSSEFVFDRVFGAETTQELVFNEVAKPLIQHVVQGYNGCCFAYGQTGSGKTYSMFGKENSVDPGTRGIIPRSVFELFKVVEGAKAGGSTARFSIFVSLLEIYLEQVRDLGRGVQASLEARSRRSSSTGSNSGRSRSSHTGLLPKGARQGPLGQVDDWTTTSLDVMEDPSGTTVVKDMTYIEVTDPSEVMAIVQEASQLRMTAATQHNDVSSRSHTVFTLSVVQQRDVRKPVTGRLHLVDLAGSERLGKTGGDTARVTETKAINKSLSSLGKVVMALTQGQEQSRRTEGEKQALHVPYRDSKLTRILKNSLQGNCMTHMLAALNPSPVHAEECFNTLQFAVRCQNLELAPRVNVATADTMPGGAGGGLGGNIDNSVAEQLAQQVAALQEELDLTHAHYQKMIEGLAGPNWTANLGPLERIAVEAAAERRSSLLGEGPKPEDQVANLGGDGKGGLADRQADGNRANDQVVRRLEGLLEATRSKLRDADAALSRHRIEADEVRDRLAAKDHTQLAEIRKLRAQAADLSAQVHDVQVEEQGKADKARQLLTDEVNRLANDNYVLRGQLEQVSGSVTNMLDRHSHSVTVEQQQRDAIRVSIEHSMRQQIDAAEKERLRQVENLKQQSSCFLEQKTQEIFSLKSQLTQMRTQHELEAKQLKSEVELLAVYAERVTEVLQKMEAGVYGMVELGGVRSLRLPPRDRPVGLDLERLQHLRQCGDTAHRLLDLVRAAAAGPRPGSRPASSRFPSSTAHAHTISSNVRGSSPWSAPASARPSARTQVPARTHATPPHTLPVPSHSSLPPPTHTLAGPSVPSPPHPLTQSQPPHTAQQPPQVTGQLHQQAQPQEQHQQQQQQQQQQLQSQEQQQHEDQHTGRGDSISSRGEGVEESALRVARDKALDDLNNEHTLQYIRSLEAALERQRAEAAAERKKQGELTVALRSAQRTSSRTPTNPVQAALMNLTLGPPPQWGFGHTHLGAPHPHTATQGPSSCSSSLSTAPGMGGMMPLQPTFTQAGACGVQGAHMVGGGAASPQGARRAFGRPATAGPMRSSSAHSGGWGGYNQGLGMGASMGGVGVQLPLQGVGGVSSRPVSRPMTARASAGPAAAPFVLKGEDALAVQQ